MSAETIPDFLAEQRDVAPEELQGLVLEFEDFWERKLWHQLTEALLKFFRDPRSAPQRLPFYKVFILKFADKINQLKLVELALPASEGCQGKSLCLPLIDSLSRHPPLDSSSQLARQPGEALILGGVDQEGR